MQGQQVLQVVDAVAREKGIEPEEVFRALEQAMRTAARRFHPGKELAAEIDRNTGEVRLYHLRRVVEKVEDPVNELSLEEARKIKPDAQPGEVLRELLPPIEQGRIAAQRAKQVIMQKLAEAEADRIVKEFEPRIGELTTGIVKRIERGNVYLDLGRAEAVMYREDCIPRETFRQGDRVRVYIRDVRKTGKGAIVVVSRTDAGMVLRLFEQEVPEIQEGVVEIRAVAREPGVRTKIAVSSNDPMVDPVGACVGARGARVQAVINELHGERIDVIEWSEDPATFVVNALAPAQIERVLIDEVKNTIEVTVREENLAVAIGKNGVNVRLASQLTGWELEILTVEEEQARREEEIEQATRLFVEELGLAPELAQTLAVEGFLSLEDVAYCSQEELLELEGVDEAKAAEMQRRARDLLLEQKLKEAAAEAGEGRPLSELEGMPQDLAEKLVSAGVRTIEELAEQAVDEIESEALTDEDRKQLQHWIIAAREACGWFDERS